MTAKDKPTLIIMAAGMGSRYGGLKQVDKMTDAGEIILDFSLYDAMMAGFTRAVFIIREEHRDIFRELVDERAGRFMDIEYAYQALDDIPEGVEIPEGREKPWGTSHAVLAARDLIHGAFAVINADDYYGPGGFTQMYDYLCNEADGDVYDCAMIGYRLENTVTENGHVARGVCEIGEDGCLKQVTERKKIMMRPEGICYTLDDGETWVKLPDDTVVFPADPLKGEYLLPEVTDRLIKEGRAKVKVLPTHDKWCGVTYQADKEDVKNILQAKKDKGEYPEKLWK